MVPPHFYPLTRATLRPDIWEGGRGRGEGQSLDSLSSPPSKVRSSRKYVSRALGCSWGQKLELEWETQRSGYALRKRRGGGEKKWKRVLKNSSSRMESNLGQMVGRDAGERKERGGQLCSLAQGHNYGPSSLPLHLASRPHFTQPRFHSAFYSAQDLSTTAPPRRSRGGGRARGRDDGIEGRRKECDQLGGRSRRGLLLSAQLSSHTYACRDTAISDPSSFFPIVRFPPI